MFKKLLKRFFDYDIVETMLVDTGKGYWQTYHVKKWKLKKFWK